MDLLGFIINAGTIYLGALGGAGVAIHWLLKAEGRHRVAD